MTGNVKAKHPPRSSLNRNNGKDSSVTSGSWSSRKVEEGRNRPPRVIRTQPEVEEHISNFYSDLFRERATKSSRDDIKQYLGEGFDVLDGLCKKNVDLTTMKEIDNPITKAEVLEAIQSGKAGRARGFSGYTKEFYRHFAPDLVDFILEYIWYTEEQGILSTNQRVDIITLLPKGDKSLKNWSPLNCYQHCTN